jgi:hypothetical protein
MKRIILLAFLGLASCGGSLAGAHDDAGNNSDSATASSDSGALGDDDEDPQLDASRASGTDTGSYSVHDAGDSASSFEETEAPNDAASRPEVGSNECNDPSGYCTLCSDGNWHCVGNQVYPPCAADILVGGVCAGKIDAGAYCFASCISDVSHLYNCGGESLNITLGWVESTGPSCSP